MVLTPTSLHRIVFVMVDALIGRNEAKTCTFLVAVILLIWCFIVVLMKKNSVKNKLAYAAILGIAGLSPFALVIYVGNAIVMRSQYDIVLFSAFGVMYGLYQISRHTYKIEKGMKIVVLFISAYLIYDQTATNLKLWYTDDFVNQQNRYVAMQIYHDVEKLGLGECPDKPIVFLGIREVTFNNCCLESDMFGASNFAWDYTGGATGTGRSLVYLRALTGQSFLGANIEQCALAVESGKAMPTYPSPGYVKYDNDDGIIIVKLSEYF